MINDDSKKLDKCLENLLINDDNKSLSLLGIMVIVLAGFSIFIRLFQLCGFKVFDLFRFDKDKYEYTLIRKCEYCDTEYVDLKICNCKNCGAKLNLFYKLRKVKKF